MLVEAEAALRRSAIGAGVIVAGGVATTRILSSALLVYPNSQRRSRAARGPSRRQDGLKRIERSCSGDIEPMWHPIWEPFWQAVDEVQLPLHFHIFPTTPPRARQEAPKVRRAAMFTGVSAFQMGLIHIIAGMIGAGVFERYPRLRVSFGESGAGWLAYALHRMDFEFEDRFRDLMKLKPSEYWRRQCKATFQFDPISAKLIDDIGVETMMWGSDY